MAISNTLSRVNQDGNGVSVSIPITFPFQATTDLKVIETIIATGVQTNKAITTDYTVTGTQDALGFYPNGGTVVANTAFASTVRWTVYRDPDQTQTLDLTENNSLPAESTEAALDRQTMLIQRVADLVLRTMRQPDGDANTMAAMPSKVARSSKFAAWDSNGDPIAAVGTSANLTPVSSFVDSLLDIGNAQTFRNDIGFPNITGKGDSIHGTAADTLGLLAAGSNGDIEISDVNQATGFKRQQLRPFSLAPNPFFQVDQLANSLTSIADDAYGHDHWYALTQTGNIQISTQTDQEDGTPSNARLTQQQAVAQRMGYACIIESSIARGLRGKTLLLSSRLRCSASQSIKVAVLEWSGTADAVTSDFVNDWTSTDYTDGAAKFFVDANITPLTDTVLAGSGGVWGTSFTLPFTVGSGCNNLMLFIWTTATAAQTVTLDISRVGLVHGSYKGDIHIPTFAETLQYAQRFYQKSFNYATAPSQNAGDPGADVFTSPLSSASLMGMQIFYPVCMRPGAPSLVTYNPGAANAQARNTTDGADDNTTGIAATERGVIITFIGNASNSIGDVHRVHWTSSLRL
jgi:hypothetical protein